jgi:hypothetical protein
MRLFFQTPNILPLPGSLGHRHGKMESLKSQGQTEKENSQSREKKVCAN